MRIWYCNVNSVVEIPDNNNFPGRLVTTEESGDLSICAREIIEKYFSEN